MYHQMKPRQTRQRAPRTPTGMAQEGVPMVNVGMTDRKAEVGRRCGGTSRIGFAKKLCWVGQDLAEWYKLEDNNVY